MNALDKLHRMMIVLAQAANEVGISMADATSAMHMFNQHKYDGWDKRKIRRYKRREKELKLKIKLEKLK